MTSCICILKLFLIFMKQGLTLNNGQLLLSATDHRDPFFVCSSWKYRNYIRSGKYVKTMFQIVLWREATHCCSLGLWRIIAVVVLTSHFFRCVTPGEVELMIQYSHAAFVWSSRFLDVFLQQFEITSIHNPMLRLSYWIWWQRRQHTYHNHVVFALLAWC